MAVIALVLGLSQAEAATRLGISIRTLRAQLQSAKRKCRARSLVDLVVSKWLIATGEDRRPRYQPLLWSPDEEPEPEPEPERLCE